MTDRYERTMQILGLVHGSMLYQLVQKKMWTGIALVIPLFFCSFFLIHLSFGETIEWRRTE